MAGVLATFAEVLRRPALGSNPVTRTAAARNVRPVEQFSRHEAPDPIRYGDTPARPSRMPIATFLSIAPYKAVMADDFFISIVAPNKTAHTLMGPGQFAPWAERSNVHKPWADAYGSLATLNPSEDNNPLLK